MSAEVTSPHAIDDETLAAFADGRLDDNERAVVRAHLDGCAECRDTVNLIAGAQDEDIIPRQATVIRGGRFRRYAPWLAAAAAAAVIVSLPPVQGQIAYYRTAGVSSLRDESKLALQRKQQARLTGGFAHRPLRPTYRSGNVGRESTDKELPLTYAARKILAEIPENTTSVRKLRALAFAHLFERELDEAVEKMEKAVQLAGQPDADLQSDLSAMYLERARTFGDDEGRDKAAALKHAQLAWQMEKKPEYAWNLALAHEELEDKNHAIRMWNEYLKLDSSSPWATEARDHLKKLNDPLENLDPSATDAPRLPPARRNPTAEN